MNICSNLFRTLFLNLTGSTRERGHVVPLQGRGRIDVLPPRRGLPPHLRLGGPLRHEGEVLPRLPRRVRHERAHGDADHGTADGTAHEFSDGGGHVCHGRTVDDQRGRERLRLHGPAVVHGEFRHGLRDEGRVLRGQRMSWRRHGHGGSCDHYGGSCNHYGGTCNHYGGTCNHYGGSHDNRGDDNDDRHDDVHGGARPGLPRLLLALRHQPRPVWEVHELRPTPGGHGSLDGATRLHVRHCRRVL